MQHRHASIAAMMILTACATSATPKAAANPARGLLDLRAAEAEVAEIAVEAARSLPQEGRTRPNFAGVYVGGTKVRSASDAVVRATGFTAVNSTGPTKVECGRQNMSTGQITPMPCPASATLSIPPTFSFAEVRATADSGYVGSAKHSHNAPALTTCITLAREGARWKVVDAKPIGDPKRCGM